MDKQEGFEGIFPPISETEIQELLNPLRLENATIEYIHHYNAIKAFGSRLFQFEKLFADIYAGVSSLEQRIENQFKS